MRAGLVAVNRCSTGAGPVEAGILLGMKGGGAPLWGLGDGGWGWLPRPSLRFGLGYHGAPLCG
jgi:hypothetical protein